MDGDNAHAAPLRGPGGPPASTVCTGTVPGGLRFERRMTQDWPVQTGYDPTWRAFKGKTIFTPHPSSLDTGQRFDWPHANFPVRSLPAAGQDWPGQEAPAEAPLEPWPPSVVEPPAPPLALQAPAPFPSPPAGKLAALYPWGETQTPAGPKRGTRPWAARPAGVATLVAAAAAAALIFVLAPKMLATPATLKTMFTTPMLVLRAAGPGEITNVAVSIGQPVEPSTVLLTLRTHALGDGALIDLKARLAQARARQTALDGPGAAPAASRQKDAAAAEIDQLQKAVAGAGSGMADQPIVAGVRGVVWSLDVQAGAKLQAGDPLAQIADCGRAFLVMQDAPPTLTAGQIVRIRMPGLRVFHGTVRPSAGVAEPPNALVIDPTGFSAASPNACPVGATAEIQPDTHP